MNKKNNENKFFQFCNYFEIILKSRKLRKKLTKIRQKQRQKKLLKKLSR